MVPGREDDCAACPGAKAFQAGIDAVLRFPMDRKSPVNPQLYFLGGAGLTWFNDFTPYRTTERPPVIVTAGESRTSHRSAFSDRAAAG